MWAKTKIYNCFWPCKIINVLSPYRNSDENINKDNILNHKIPIRVNYFWHSDWIEAIPPTNSFIKKWDEVDINECVLKLNNDKKIKGKYTTLPSDSTKIKITDFYIEQIKIAEKAINKRLKEFETLERTLIAGMRISFYDPIFGCRPEALIKDKKILEIIYDSNLTKKRLPNNKKQKLSHSIHNYPVLLNNTDLLPSINEEVHVLFDDGEIVRKTVGEFR